MNTQFDSYLEIGKLLDGVLVVSDAFIVLLLLILLWGITLGVPASVFLITLRKGIEEAKREEDGSSLLYLYFQSGLIGFFIFLIILYIIELIFVNALEITDSLGEVFTDYLLLNF